MEVDAICILVANAHVRNLQIVERTIHPHTAFGMLNPDVVYGGICQRTANAVDLVVVFTLNHIAPDGEIGEVDVGAGDDAAVRLPVAVEAFVISGLGGEVKLGVPHARALDGDIVDLQLGIDLVGTGRGPQNFTLARCVVDGLLRGGSGITVAAGVNACIGSKVDRVGGLAERCPNLLKVNQVNRSGNTGTGHSYLLTSQHWRHHAVDFVIIVMGAYSIGIVVERISTINPAIARCSCQGCLGGIVNGQAKGRILTCAAVGIRNTVTNNN